jgi:hypothetical protein
VVCVSGGALALVPLRSSVLSPGAGNKPKKAIKAQKRSKEREDGYIGEGVVPDRQVHAAAIRRDDDGDSTTILSIDHARFGLRSAWAVRRDRTVRAV